MLLLVSSTLQEEVELLQQVVKRLIWEGLQFLLHHYLLLFHGDIGFLGIQEVAQCLPPLHHIFNIRIIHLTPLNDYPSEKRQTQRGKSGSPVDLFFRYNS
jgi:hypothetical protein